MKNIHILILILIPFFFLFHNVCIAQSISDTIVTTNNKLIVCKVTKVLERDIEYIKDPDPDAIIYVIPRKSVIEIRLGNGKIENMLMKETENVPVVEVIDKKSAIKVNFYSPIYDHLAITGERSLIPGVNIEASIGFINNTMFNFGYANNWNVTQGGTVTMGPKLMLDRGICNIDGEKYTHSLKGFYFQPEVILTRYIVRNVQYAYYINSSYSSNVIWYSSDYRVNNISFLILFGYQINIRKSFLIGFKMGMGYALTSGKYTNKTVEHLVSQNYYYNRDYSTYMFNQVRLSSGFPMVLTSSVTIGFAF